MATSSTNIQKNGSSVSQRSNIEEAKGGSCESFTNCKNRLHTFRGVFMYSALVPLNTLTTTSIIFYIHCSSTVSLPPRFVDTYQTLITHPTQWSLETLHIVKKSYASSIFPTKNFEVDPYSRSFYIVGAYPNSTQSKVHHELQLPV